MVDSPVPDIQSRYFPETGCTVEGAFLDFLQQYGIDFCGLPLTDSFLDAGVSTQYFQRLALEEPSPGQLRPKAIGAEVLHLREQVRTEKQALLPQPSGIVLGIPSFELVNQVGSLPRHATARYPSRPLDHIRQLVIHHTGAPPDVGVEQIAGYHVTTLGWPAIGYHFVIDTDGGVAQTNALATISHHARQYNGSGVGIALVGNFAHSAPSLEQLDGAALLCAWLLRELSLPIESIKGHQELVNVACPGDQWLEGARWKFALMDRVEQLLAGVPITRPAAAAPVESVPAADSATSASADNGGAQALTDMPEERVHARDTIVTPPLPQDMLPSDGNEPPPGDWPSSEGDVAVHRVEEPSQIADVPLPVDETGEEGQDAPSADAAQRPTPVSRPSEGTGGSETSQHAESREHPGTD